MSEACGQQKDLAKAVYLILSRVEAASCSKPSSGIWDNSAILWNKCSVVFGECQVLGQSLEMFTRTVGCRIAFFPFSYSVASKVFFLNTDFFPVYCLSKDRSMYVYVCLFSLWC